MSVLTWSALPTLPSRIARPRRTRGPEPAIVHIGVGGFHRSHMAWYLDRLLEAGEQSDGRWRIHGVCVLPSDEQLVRDLTEQEGLYSLAMKAPEGTVERRVIGALNHVSWLGDPVERDAVVERLTDEQTAVVSLTITEGGYPVDVETLEFHRDHVSVRADLGGGWRTAPSTAFGLLLAGLARRHEAGLRPFTVLSCDNIRHNGRVARAAVLGLARLEAPELVAWLEEAGAFPNCMVDRITPVTTDADRAAVAEALGVVDRRPVVSESFAQWVLEDDFTCARPALERVGVQMAADVEPYELMKLRLLNAGHQVIGHIGRQAGLDYAHEAIANPVIGGLLRRFMREEATPTLPEVPGQDLEAYQAELIRRFGSPYVGDTLARLCAEASDRIPKFLLGTIRDNLLDNGRIEVSAFTLAAWALGSLGRADNGAPFTVSDPLRDSLRSASEAGDFLGHPLFAEIAGQARLREEFQRQLDAIRTHGVLSAGQALLDQQT